MCVVSQVMDYGRDIWPGLQPHPWGPAVPSPSFDDLVKTVVKKDDVGRLPTKAEIEAFLKLVKDEGV